MYSNIKSYLILFGGVFALSASAIFVKVADAPSSVIAFYRLLIAGVTLFPFFLFSTKCQTEFRTLSKNQWIQIISAGLFLALHYVLWFESLNYTSIASSTVIVCLQPLFSLWLEKFISKKKIKSTAIIGCFIALCGCFVIGFGDLQVSGKSFLGDLLAFVAAGVISLYFFVGESVRKDISAVTYSTLGYLISAIILFIYVMIQGKSLGGYTVQTWWAFTALALISTIGGNLYSIFY